MTDTASEQNTIWLTQDAYDRLKAELDHLAGPARQDLANRIGAARDEGDLRENGGYHAAKEEQGKAELRIRQLEDMLRRAQVGEAPPDDGVAEPGMKVSVKFAGDDDVETFLLGSREMMAVSDDLDLQVYSPQSPIGAAVSGKKKGDKVSYEAPNGKSVKIEIVDAVPFSG